MGRVADGVLFEDEQIRIDASTMRFGNETVAASSLSSVQGPKKSSSWSLVTALGAVGFIGVAIWGWRGLNYVQTLGVFAVIFVLGLWLQGRSRTQTISAQIGLQWVVVYRSENAESVTAVHNALTSLIGGRQQRAG